MFERSSFVVLIFLDNLFIYSENYQLVFNEYKKKIINYPIHEKYCWLHKIAELLYILHNFIT